MLREISSVLIGIIILVIQSSFAVTFFPIVGIEFVFILMLSLYRHNSPVILFIVGIAADILFFRTFGTSFLIYILLYFIHSAFLMFVNTRSLLSDFVYTIVFWLVLAVIYLGISSYSHFGSLQISLSIPIILASALLFLLISISMWATQVKHD